jgi:PleD family two-component response regulator
VLRNGFRAKEGDAMLKVIVFDEHWTDVPSYRKIEDEFPGCEVHRYTDYARACADCIANSPDLFLVDADTWKVDPAALTRRVRARSGRKKLMIVLIGSRKGKLAEQARMDGADVFARKPIRTRPFMQLLHETLDLRRARATLAGRSSLAGTRRVAVAAR